MVQLINDDSLEFADSHDWIGNAIYPTIASDIASDVNILLDFVLWFGCHSTTKQTVLAMAANKPPIANMEQ